MAPKMDDAKPETINFPEWSECSSKNGLDPLGMQNSSIKLYQALLPGISNVTLRIRYYGLYAWLSHTYAQNVRDTNPESWKRYIRRTEALFALISYQHGGETGVAGVDWASKALDNSTSEIVEFAKAAEPGSDIHYLSQAWGAYGAAYGSQLREIGILSQSSDHDIPLPGADIGEAMATAFEDALGPLATLFYEIIERGSVTKTELDQFALLAPSEIGLKSDERALYQNILIGDSDSDDSNNVSRRQSVLLIMKVTALIGHSPKPDEVRWILYAGYDGQGGPLDLSDQALEVQRQRWWIYQANDLCHVALETLLKFTLDNLSLYHNGLSLERLVPTCVDQVLEAADHKPQHWADFLNGIQPTINAYERNNASSEWSLSQDIVRGAGRSAKKFCTPDIAWKAIKLLAILHKRIQQESVDLTAEFEHLNPNAFRSLLSETRFLDRQLDESFEETLGKIIEERVVRRHLWIAMRKFRYQRDYTFLFEMDEGRLRLREKDGPVFTTPRLGSAINFLKDTHLIGGQGLTGLGEKAVSST